MWDCKIVSLFLLTVSTCSVATGSDPYTIEDLLKDVTADKDNHNLVDDIAHFVVHKVEEATQAVGANGVLDPAKLQEYVTAALALGTEWLTEKTGDLYDKIRDKVSQWWSGMQTRTGPLGNNQQEVSEEVKREVVKQILTKIEEELRSKNITGIEEKDLQKWILPVVKTVFADLFSFPVKPDGKSE